MTQISLIAADMFTVTSLADEFNFKKRFYFTKKLRFHPNYILETSNKPFEERYGNKILSVEGWNIKKIIYNSLRV